MRAGRRSGLTAAVALVVALSGCGGDDDAAESAAGTWGEEGAGQPHLLLDEGGEFSGSDGCNRLFGSWEQDGAAISFGEVGTTLMACDGVDTWLSAADSAEVDGSTLRILDADGTEIGTLDRG